MSSLKTLGAIAVLAPLGAAVVLACANEGDQLPVEDPTDASRSVIEPQDADADAAEDADAAPTDPCSASGLCIVPAPIDGRINVTSLSGSGPNDVWGVGTDRTIVHYNGAVWEKADTIPSDGASFTMRAVWVGGPGDVWVADGPAVRHSTGWKGPSGTEWTSFVVGKQTETATGISGKGGTVVIARQLWGSFDDWGPPIVACSGWGQDGPVDPVYVENTHFTTDAFDGLWSIVMTRPDEAWVTSIATIWRPANRVVRAHLVNPDGGAGDDAAPDAGPSWQMEEHDSRTERNLYGVWGDEEAVWLVGEGGVLRRMKRANVPGRVFENVPSPVTTALRGIFGFGANDVWAVGDDATVLHWDGNVWTKLASPFDTAKDKPRLFTVWGSAPNNVWIGGNGVMLHFEGKAP
jgi:hypothetical protein